MENKQEKILEFVERIDNNDFGFYFFTLDTKGNPLAGIANIYEHVKVLNELGYKAYILHDKDDYHGVGEWLGESYAKLPHVSIEKKELNLSPIDYLIIPEIFANVMESVKDFPCKKIVLSQSYNAILELLRIGERWDFTYGFRDIITTSQKQGDYIKRLFPSVINHIIPPSIPDYFKPSNKLKKPIISILTRDQKSALRIIKSFYLQYPMYKWLSFRELRGLPRKTFAEQLGQSCLAVWVDDISSFGTFPLECIQSDTPVVGKIPDMVPDWMEDEGSTTSNIKLKNNGIWTNDILAVPTLIADYMRAWLEDSIPQEFIDGINASKDQFTEEIVNEKIKNVYGNFVQKRKEEFETLLKIEEKTK